jgi:hypothetical protein
MLIQDQNPTGGQTRYISGGGQNLEELPTALTQTTFSKSQRTGSSFMKPSSSLRGLKYPEQAVL